MEWEYGKIVELKGEKRKVLGVCGDIVYLSDPSNHDEYGGFDTKAHYEKRGCREDVAPLEVWVNVYSDMISVSKTREKADDNACDGRVRCVRMVEADDEN